MTDFDTHPICTADRLADLERKLALAKDGFREIADGIYDPWNNGAKAQKIAATHLAALNKKGGAQPAREWVWLTEIERNHVCAKLQEQVPLIVFHAIESKLREKNAAQAGEK